METDEQEKKEDGTAATTPKAGDAVKDGTSTSSSSSTNSKPATDGASTAISGPTVVPEAKTQTLNNPARVTAGQFRVLTAPKNQRYQPVKEILAGCVMLLDTTPEVTEKIVAAKTASTALPEEALDEPEPPAPFDYLG